jgi:hypothetical protein
MNKFKFKPGDKVIRINTNTGYLTIGKIYIVEKQVSDKHVILKNSYGIEYDVPNFKLVSRNTIYELW